MDYYHVRITQASAPSYDETKIDLTFEELDTRFLSPYREGSDIVINGKVIPPSNIDRIRISKSSQDSDSIRGIVRDERRRSDVLVGGISEEWEIANKAEDVTDELITTPPGGRPRVSNASYREPRPSADTREVFVVHGRNMAARDALFQFLRAIGLRPLEWTEAVRSTGKGSPYIGDILDAAFSRAHAIVVLFTPDDEARIRKEFQSISDLPHETDLTGQARPNVLFEAGMAMGRSEDRTVFVEIGDLRPFSDVAGRHAVRLDNSSARRHDLAMRLQTAGCPINLEGTDWYHVGDFEADTRSNGPLHQQDISDVSESEEKRFAEMLVASRKIREHLSQFLTPDNPNRTPVEGQNIVIALGALAGQMDALGMKELNQRLEVAVDIWTKLNKVEAMLAYFEMLVVGRNYERAKEQFASYNPKEDDEGRYPEDYDNP